jgi:hypothetical protein
MNAGLAGGWHGQPEEDQMLIGFLLPLLRRLSPRVRILAGIAVMAAGLALALSLLLRGHAPGSALLIRIGLLVTLAGLAQFVSGVRGARRRELRGSDAKQSDDQP